MLLHESPNESKAGEILAAAERLFCRHGYDGVSVSAVAAEAGVCKATVFHHFKSKDELYLAVIQQVRREVSHDLLKITASGGDRPIGESLTRVADTYVRHLFSQGDRICLLMRDMLEARPAHGEVLAKDIFGGDFSGLLGLVREAQERGEIRREVSPTLPVLMLVAACVFVFQSRELIRHLPGADAEALAPGNYARQMVDILLRGVVNP